MHTLVGIGWKFSSEYISLWLLNFLFLLSEPFHLLIMVSNSRGLYTFDM